MQGLASIDWVCSSSFESLDSFLLGHLQFSSLAPSMQSVLQFELINLLAQWLLLEFQTCGKTKAPRCYLIGSLLNLLNLRLLVS